MDKKFKLELREVAASHVESFNAFLDTYCQRIVEYLPPVYFSPTYDQILDELNHTITPPSYVKLFIKSVRIGNPKRSDSSDDADEKLYPVQARQSHITYSAPLYVTFAFQVAVNGVDSNEVVSKSLIAGQVPVMVRSKCCNLHGLSSKDMVEKGEDECEPGGYFIIKGNERIIRHVISSRCNYPIGVKRDQFKSKDAFNTDYAIIMRSQRHDGSVVGNILCYTQDERCVLRVMINKSIKTIPFATLLKAAKPQMSNDELKSRLIEDFLHNEEMTILFYNVFQDLTFREPLVADVDFIENRHLHQLGKACWHKVRTYMRPGASLADCGLFVMKNYICVQSESLDDKFECLLHMFKKLILLARGYIVPDPIDSLAFQEVTLPGQIYSTVLKESLYTSLVKLKSLYTVEIEYFKKHLALSSDLQLGDKANTDEILLEFCSTLSLFNYLTEKVATEVPGKLNYFLSTGNISSSHFEFLQNLGWTVIADRVNYFRFLSHFRSVHRGNIFIQMRNTSARKLLGESWGFLCPVHTPDGAPCGLLTHFSQHAMPLTRPSDTQVFKKLRVFLSNQGYPTDINSSGICLDYKYVFRAVPFVVDGVPIARIPRDKVAQLMQVLIYAKINNECGILEDFEIFNTCKTNGQVECINVLTFPGRLIRPVKNIKFDTVELIGLISQQWSFIAVNHTELAEHRKRIQLERARASSNAAGQPITLSQLPRNPDEDGVAGQQAEKLLENIPVDYTHVELEEQAILSISASCTPFSDYNQSPRNMYQCQMLKQSMGVPVHSQPFRSDNKLYNLTTPQSPLVSAGNYTRLGLDDYATGANAVVAIIAYTGFDMEDAMVINKSSIERGLLHASIYKTKVIDAAPPGSTVKDSLNYVFKGLPGGLMKSSRNRNSARQTNEQLGRDGLVQVGQLITSGAPLARIEAIGDNSASGGKSRVELYKDSEDARVVSVTLVSPNQYKNISYSESVPCYRALIKLRSVRKPDIGDKFANRHGQKGILSMIWRHEDMPFTELGIVPDILFNPHGFPSRMTIGMLIEAIAGKSAAVTGACNDGTTFAYSNRDKPVTEFFGQVLQQAGFRYYGTEDMYSGTTGTMIKTSIFMGFIYYQRLRHMVADKAQVRSTGPIDALTHQPVHGKKKMGGIRFGEMERDSLVSYGAPFLLQDRLLNCSDLHLSFICPSCGSLLSPSTDEGDRRSIGKTSVPLCIICKVPCQLVKIPYVLRYLVNELASINIGLNFVLRQFGKVVQPTNNKTD